MAKRSGGGPKNQHRQTPLGDVAAGGGGAQPQGEELRAAPGVRLPHLPRGLTTVGGCATVKPRRSLAAAAPPCWRTRHTHGGDAASPCSPAGCTTWDGPSLRNRGHRNRHHCSQGEPARRSPGTHRPAGGTAGAGTAWQAGDAGASVQRGAAACVGQCGQGFPGGQRMASIGLRRQGTHR